jgi:hypothetical protein
LESEWIRVVEMDSASTLVDLHDLIQDAARFDRDHPFEFFAGRNYRHRAMTFGDALDEADACDDYEAMTLERIFPLPKNMKLFYHFDFGDDWKFEIRRTRVKPKEPAPRVKYPRVIERRGPQLRQYRW